MDNLNPMTGYPRTPMPRTERNALLAALARIEDDPVPDQEMSQEQGISTQMDCEEAVLPAHDAGPIIIVGG